MKQAIIPRKKSDIGNNDMQLEVSDNRTVEIDREGFLLNSEDWDEKVMEALIKAHEVAGHKPVGVLGRAMIMFVRSFYEDHMRHPSMNELIKMHAEKEEVSFKNAEHLRDALFEMFPHGPVAMLAKLAGLPKQAVAEEMEA
jgi:tRNA 2-thiouridine synthesizing protein E